MHLKRHCLIQPTTQESVNVIPQFEVQDDGMIEFMHNINIMTFPDEIIQTNKQARQIVPLCKIVRGPLEPTRANFAFAYFACTFGSE
jgi:hypothetical protein